MSIGPPLFQVDHRHKIDMCNEGNRAFFVKIHIESVIDIDTTDCNDTGSLEVCTWKNRVIYLYLPIFYFRILLLNEQDTSDIAVTRLNFLITI